MLSAYFFNDDGTCTHYKNGRRSEEVNVMGCRGIAHENSP